MRKSFSAFLSAREKEKFSFKFTIPSHFLLFSREFARTHRHKNIHPIAGPKFFSHEGVVLLRVSRKNSSLTTTKLTDSQSNKLEIA